MCVVLFGWGFLVLPARGKMVLHHAGYFDFTGTQEVVNKFVRGVSSSTRLMIVALRIAASRLVS